MEGYIEPLENTMQALDFTYSVKRTELSEPPILDLSCKKNLSRTSHESVSCESRSNSPVSSEKQSEGKQTSGFESEEDLLKSRFEGRTFMVTPPSESDSPKKNKYETIYKCSNVTDRNVIGQFDRFPVLPMTVPIPMVPGVIPALFTSNHDTELSLMVGTSATSTTSSTTSGKDSRPISPELSKKTPRPFKAYPKDPLSFSIASGDQIYDPNSNEAYSDFRKRMLESVKRSNETTNTKMRRVSKSPTLPTSTVDEKDAAYWERRRKNNEAAKRSRDARRAKEDEIAIRAAFLEQENIKLRYELVALRNETAKLRCMVYTT
ncbi:transcription factor giant [Lasioglossum baleicum]|uniref:transcription factor giant n=1 Tax=Lasioglossum baleicum TaxID=434251 RepID=UPI003FCE2119